jgi:hypothetical protein
MNIIFTVTKVVKFTVCIYYYYCCCYVDGSHLIQNFDCSLLINCFKVLFPYMCTHACFLQCGVFRIYSQQWAGSCEYGDEPSGSGATELVS